jgi:hypothetical protein
MKYIILTFMLVSVLFSMRAAAETSETAIGQKSDTGLWEQVIWQRDRDMASLVCQSRRDLDEDDAPVPTLRCWVREGDASHVRLGNLLVDADVSDYPERLQVLSSRLLLSSWNSGTGQRHFVLDGSLQKPKVVVQEAGKGGMIVVSGPAGEVALLHEDFDCCEWNTPTKAQVYCWPENGKLRQGETTWKNRFNWLREHCWPSTTNTATPK